MKKYLILISLLITIFSCNRFEHTFEPSVSNIALDQFADTTVEIFNNTNQNNYLELSFLFSDNYYNHDNTKDEMIEYFEEFFLVDPNTTFFVDNVIISPSLNISWHFTATNSSLEILADTTFVDFLIEENEGFVFYGDQNNKRKVVIELFTGQWCSNCPSAEEALHSLRMQYGSRFSYVEYHVGDQLAGDFSDIYSYYPSVGTLPLGIVNGNEEIIYSAPSAEEVAEQIENAITPLLQEIPNVLLADVQTELIENTLSCSVNVEVNASVPTEDLILVAVLMEDYNADYPNYHGDPHHNIALKRVELDISALNLEEPVNIDIEELDVLPQWYVDNGTGLPEDLTLVLWVQTLEAEYNENTCAAYNVIEVPINN